jgi:hypothetical protein
LIQPAAPPSLGLGPDERIVIWAFGSEAEDLLELRCDEGDRSPGGGSYNSLYNRSAKRRARVPTRTQVRGKGAIAVAAQAMTENKLKVTATEIRPAKKR